MGFLNSIKSLFSGDGTGASDPGYEIYVRCQRCGETLKTSLNLSQNLTPRDEGGFIARKTLVGGGEKLCFQRIEVTLIFNNQRQLVEQDIAYGEFITAEAYAQTHD